MKFKEFLRTPQKRTVVYIVVITLFLFVLFMGLKVIVPRFINNKGDDNYSADAQTTSIQPSAQEDFTEGDNREAGNSLREDEGSAYIRDTSGEGIRPVDQSKFI